MGRIKMGKGIRTRPVGDVVTLNGRKYEVVEKKENTCLLCDLYDGAPDNPCSADVEVCGFCYKDFRTDNKSVAFKEVKDEGL